MAINVVNLGASVPGAIAAPDFESSADATSYANASWTPPTADNSVVLLWVYNTKATTVGVAGTVTGNGLTWTLQASNAVDPGAQTHRLSLYAAISTGTASAGATTVDFAGVTQSGIIMFFQQVTGVDLTGALAGVIIQQPTNTTSSANSLAAALSAASDAANRFMAGVGHGANEGADAEAGWDEIDDWGGASPGRALMVMWDADSVADTSPTVSWATAAAAVAISIEVVAAPDSATNYDETVDMSKVVTITDGPTMAWGTSVDLSAVKTVSDSPILAYQTTLTLAEIFALAMSAQTGISSTIDLSRVEAVDFSVLQALQTTVDLARVESATFNPIQALITAIGVDKVVSVSIISAAVVIVTKGNVTVLDFSTSPVTVTSYRANNLSASDTASTNVEASDS